MPFTAQELENIHNQALDAYVRGEILTQTIQDKPLLKAMRANMKTFAGGKGEIKGNVKGDYTTEFLGYSHDDTVTFTNPANVKQYKYTWFEMHGGFSTTFTELKHDGITVVDSVTGGKTTEKSGREMQAITDILADKFEDMDEGLARSLNETMWRDGTQDPKAFPGVLAALTTTPTTGVFAGIDRAANSWWRHRTSLGITQSATNHTLIRTLGQELRQLRRYGGRPTLWLCGSSFLDALDLEARTGGNSQYTTENVSGKKVNIDVANFGFSGMSGATFEYDPTLDDLGYAKYCFAIDPKHMRMRVMEGEDMRRHNPARPYDKFVLFHSVTFTGCMETRRLNVHGVYSIA